MSKRSRIFFGLLLVYVVGMAYLMNTVLSDLDPRYRESAEESLVETSQLLATLIEQDVRDGAIDTRRLDQLFKTAYVRQFSAQIFDFRKTKVELRAYVTDRTGTVLYDSTGLATGQNYATWRDVSRALQGEYGARSTRDVADDPDSSVMYVAAPVRGSPSGEIIGVVSVGKPVRSFGQFVIAARERTITVGLVSALTGVFLAFMVSIWLVRPLGLITDYVRFVRAQQGFHPLRLLRRAWDVMRAGYDEMRDALAGRNYVSDYVHTLTHEIKSPLSAIRGAAELLQEPMDDAQRQRFLQNIQRETQRIQEMVDRMMELTALETRRVLDDKRPVAMRPLLEELAHASQGVAAQRGCRISVTGQDDVIVQGDPFLLRRAVSNLLDNALDFSPDQGQIDVGLAVQGKWVHITVRDQGPGIPDYAQDKVFEKFYSLNRPRTNKKSTGLGLSFVKEIASLHHGRVELGNRPATEGEGAIAKLWLRRYIDPRA